MTPIPPKRRNCHHASGRACSTGVSQSGYVNSVISENRHTNITDADTQSAFVDTRICRLPFPTMRKKLVYTTRRMGRGELEHVLEITLRIVAVELGGLDEGHDYHGALAGAEQPGEYPIGSPESYWPYAIF